MADQIYFEEGYIDSNYFGYIAEAEISLSGAMTASLTGEIAITSGYYIPDYIETGYFVEGTTHEASASLDAAATVISDVEGIFEFDTQMQNISTLTVDNERIRDFDASISGAMTASIQSFVGVVGDVGLYTAFTSSIEAERTRDNDITLSTIVNLSLQSDVVRAGSSNLSASFGASTTAASTRTYDSSLAASFSVGHDADIITDTSATLSSSYALSADAEKIRYVELEATELPVIATSSTTAIQFVSKWPSAYRPVSWDKYYTTGTSPVTTTNIEFNSSIKQYGTHSVQLKTGGYKVVSDPLYTNSYIIPADEEFIFEAWVYFEDDNQVSVDTPFFIHGELGTTYDNLQSLPTNTVWAIGEDNDRWTAKLRKSDGTYITLAQTNPAIPQEEWVWVCLRRRSNGDIQFWIKTAAGGITQADYTNYTGAIQGSFGAGDNDEGRLILQNYNQSNNGDIFYDSVHYQIGNSEFTAWDDYPISAFADMEGRGTEDTLVLAHFDNNFDDDLAILMEAEADLSVSATLTASVGTIADITALEAGTFTLSADVERTVTTVIYLDDNFTATAIPGYRLYMDAVSLQAFATTVNVVNKIGNTLVDIPMTATLGATVNEITQLSSALEIAATISTQSVIEAIASAELDGTFTLPDVYAGPYIYNVDADLNSAFTVGADVARTRTTNSTLNTQTTQTVDGVITADGVADIVNTATLGIDNERIRETDIALDFIGSELVAAAKIGDFLITLNTQSTLSTDAVKKTGNVIGIDTAFAITLEPSTTKTITVDLDAIFTQPNTDAVAGIVADASLDSVFTSATDAVKTVDAVIDISGAMTATTVAKGNLAGEIDLDTSATLTVSATRTRDVELNATGQYTIACTNTVVKGFEADIVNTITLTAQGRIITLLEELEYVILPETREFAITDESREYAIFEETREYTL